MEPTVASHIDVHLPAIWNWGAGVVVLVIVGIGLRLEAISKTINRGMAKQSKVLEELDDLKTMHEHSDDYEFGTKKTNEMISGLVKACQATCQQNARFGLQIESLTGLLRYYIERETGEKLPPSNNHLRMK